ncbi:RNA-binding KH domain-containing protein RCF3-like [Silene latifolia]|uniref:RNA-binding KH domain-containing protein RCF3-like n=1 Tax=Silene latifolia TaxID=37657 RepID=UPI003D782712
MDRSRSKRSYYYDDHHHDHDYDPEPYSRTRPRYNSYNSSHHAQNHYSSSRHRGGGFGGSGGGVRMGGKLADSSIMVTTSYRILCHDLKVGGVIGKGGSIIKAIRQHTGAYINVHELLEGDEERIIEISDTRRRDPDGRMPAFSPAQEALYLIHEKILESEAFGEDDGGYGRGGNNNGREVSRLVVTKTHIGSLLGKGGRIIEQMRMETKTQIRILPRDHNAPRCVSMGEEIVQIVGDIEAVKDALSVVASRLRESQHRDRSNFQGRHHSDDRYEDDGYEDDFGPSRRDGSPYHSRSNSYRNRSTSFSSRSGGYAYESQTASRTANDQTSFGDLVFRILCPNDKVDSVVGSSSGILDLLQNEIGVDVKVSDPVDGSEERIITVFSDEGPEDELFPAQEALLHIQTCIVDLVPDKDSSVTTRLLVASRDARCFDDDESLSEMKKLTGADIEILPRENVPAFISSNDVLVQIVGEIKAAREALVEVTAKLRSYLYKEFLQRDMLPPSNSSPPYVRNGRHGSVSVKDLPPTNESLANGSPALVSNGTRTDAPVRPNKDAGLSSETSKQNGNDRREESASSRREDSASSLNRIQLPMVTRSTLEVVIPEYAISRLVAKSKIKLAQISELSGAKVTLIDDEPNSSEKFLRISGTPEQAERAQSLLQGFFLSIQDGP